MRVQPLAVWILLLAASATAPPGQAAPALSWHDWVQDDSGDAAAVNGVPVPAADPRADLTSVQAAFDGELVHVRFQTAASGGLAPDTPDYMSNLFFVLVGPHGGGQSPTIRGTMDGFTVALGADDPPAGSWGVDGGSRAWDFQAWFRVASFVPDYTEGPVTLQKVDAYTWSSNTGKTDAGTGPDLALQADGSPVPDSPGIVDAVWSQAEGPDFAGGSSLALTGPYAYVTYYVYDADRGTDVGVYVAKLKLGKATAWHAERVGGFQPSGDERDAMMRTKTAADGTAAILYSPCPSGDCPMPWTFRQESGGWKAEDPASGLPVAHGSRNVADLVMAGGRIVAAVPLQGDRLALRERGAGGWTTLHEFGEARLPRLAIGADGQVQVAFFRFVPGLHSQVDGGKVVLSTQSGGWTEADVVAGVIDQTGFWDAEVDGSFAFALDPSGTPAFAWDRWLARDDDLPERGFGAWVAGHLVAEEAPLTPTHGNPQLAMRMGFDRDGNAHVASGYGGTDVYAIRRPDGTWARQDVDRHDVWDFDVAADGSPVFAYTEPHGGTTAAVSWLRGPVQVTQPGAEGSATGGAAMGPARPASAPAALALALGLVALALQRRRT